MISINEGALAVLTKQKTAKSAINNKEIIISLQWWVFNICIVM